MKLTKTAVMAIALATNSASGSWAPISDKERYCGAELIVAGTLGDVQERYMSVTAGHGKDALQWYLDLGQIKDAKLIKGDDLNGKDVAVLFDSKAQQGPFSHLDVTHSAGEGGIWIISERDYYTGHYRLHKPTNPLPLTEEQSIRSTLKKYKCG